jgi:N6-adenosine-specific RNA methylase IME4
LWAVSPQIPEALRVMERWGFRYKTVAFVWEKHHANGEFVANLGRWTMGTVEICLLGTRGRPQRVTKNVRQLVVAARREHSRKPDEVRNRIVELMGDVPRVELFCRLRHTGWDAWGNEVSDPEPSLFDEVTS